MKNTKTLVFTGHRFRNPSTTSLPSQNTNGTTSKPSKPKTSVVRVQSISNGTTTSNGKINSQITTKQPKKPSGKNAQPQNLPQKNNNIAQTTNNKKNSQQQLLDDSQINWCPAPEFLIVEANSFSFSVPKFDGNKQPETGQDFQNLFNSLTKCLEDHIWNANRLISTNKNLPEKAQELLRVGVGHSQLLLNKRMKQFGEQLERYLNPTANNPKPTLLGDLHGLWALIDMQLDGIRSTFAAIENFRKNGWDACRISSNIF
ncbi:unnamed protein product [Meloidogyne enterolobii]|uniref:Uncharacterized protein n=1 Tax=Meloidogyne enterolobii TaxID=390850 RepID=A0ACB0YMY6_MELEN